MIKAELKIHKDTIAEKLDELADLSEYWKKNRDKGRNPNAIRSALIMLCNEIVEYDECMRTGKGIFSE